MEVTKRECELLSAIVADDGVGLAGAEPQININTMESRILDLECEMSKIRNNVQEDIVGDIIENTVRLEKVDVKPDDTIIIKCPIDKYPLNFIKAIGEGISEVFPDNTWIFLPHDFEIHVNNLEEIGFSPATATELEEFVGFKTGDELNDSTKS